MYNYEAETLNGVNGATDNKSGAKISCKVCFRAANGPTNAAGCWMGARHFETCHLLCRLKWKCLRRVASSSVQQSALWKRFLMWMETETLCTVPRLELRLSKRPWPSELSLECPVLTCIWNPSTERWWRVAETWTSQQEPAEDHSWRTAPGQSLPWGWRAHQHPEHQEGNRVHIDGPSDGGGQERQHGNCSAVFQYLFFNTIDPGQTDSPRDKDVSQCVDKKTVLTAGGQSPR